MKVWLVIIIIGSLSIAKAQTFSADIAKINRSYYNLNRNVNVTTNYKPTKGESISEKMTLRMKDIDNFYITSQGTEVLVSKGYKIALNKTFKVLILDSNSADIAYSIPISFFDTIAKVYSKISLNKTSDGQEVYTLVPLGGSTTKIKIYFRRTDFLINKIEVTGSDYETNADYVMVFQYSYLPFTHLPPLSDYVIADKKGRFNINKRFEGYEFVDYLNLKK